MGREDRNMRADETGNATPVRRAGRQGRRDRVIRIAPAFWMAALALFIVAIGILPAAGDPVPSRPATAITITVAPADTLWAIATAHPVAGVSTAQLVTFIQETNRLHGGRVEAGSLLRVPADPDDVAAYAQADSGQGAD